MSVRARPCHLDIGHRFHLAGDSRDAQGMAHKWLHGGGLLVIVRRSPLRTNNRYGWNRSEGGSVECQAVTPPDCYGGEPLVSVPSRWYHLHEWFRFMPISDGSIDAL